MAEENSGLADLFWLLRRFHATFAFERMIVRMKTFNARSYVWPIYAILWGMVWSYPVLTAMIAAVKANTAVSWDGVFHGWVGILPFFLLFLCHRLPVHFLFMRRHIYVYILSVVGLLCLFGLCHHFWGVEEPHEKPAQEHHVPPHEQPHEQPPHEPPHGMPGSDRDEAMHIMDVPVGRPGPSDLRQPRPAKGEPIPEGVPKPLLLDLVIAALMLGFDLSIALLFRYQAEQEKARRLETEHLRYELEHLKAQLNPHFFMNMLNNIHGMVELDPVKAQGMIMELSKLMRYVLYEGAKPLTSLSEEARFINNYVELMRKRYSIRKVKISVELPEGDYTKVLLPPLLFISIIENAFKHGISYQSPSFVDIRLSLENGMVHLYCANSIHPRSKGKDYAGGVGLVNLRQRLQLLYGSRFTFNITEDDEKTYRIELIIPPEYDTNTMHGS